LERFAAENGNEDADPSCLRDVSFDERSPDCDGLEDSSEQDQTTIDDVG
jgi:hypothetical protein